MPTITARSIRRRNQNPPSVEVSPPHCENGVRVERTVVLEHNGPRRRANRNDRRDRAIEARDERAARLTANRERIAYLKANGMPLPGAANTARPGVWQLSWLESWTVKVFPKRRVSVEVLHAEGRQATSWRQPGQDDFAVRVLAPLDLRNARRLGDLPEAA
jgi:hypothetical protein